MIDRFKLAFKDNVFLIIASTIILIASLLIGYYFHDVLQSYLNPVVSQINQNVKNGVIKLTFKSIFSNNIKIVFLMFVFGAVFCFSALILGFNGLFVGYYIADANDFLNSILLIVPHGIFEFSSCILACTSGFVLFKFICKFLKTWIKSDNNFFSAYEINSDILVQSMMLFIIASLLMVIAGIFEVYLTIPIAQFLTSVLS